MYRNSGNTYLQSRVKFVYIRFTTDPAVWKPRALCYPFLRSIDTLVRNLFMTIKNNKSWGNKGNTNVMGPKRYVRNLKKWQTESPNIYFLVCRFN